MSIYRGVGSGITSDALTVYLSVLADITAAQAAAEAAQTAAEAAQTAAELAETNAEAAQTAAELAETNAEAAEVAADGSESLAQEWAEKVEDSAITGYPGSYSALHHSAKANDAQVAAEAAQLAAETAETNAELAETNAEAAQLAAETARDLAQDYAGDALSYLTSTSDLYDLFDDRFLGSKASDPTLDNDGDALVEGALYWNSTSNVLKAYDGAAWQSAVVPTSDYVAVAGDTMTGNLALPVTDSSTPALTFAGDTNTGIASAAADTLNIIVAGSSVRTIDSSTELFTKVQRAPNGTAALPAYSFANNSDLGIYRSGTDTLGIAAGGVNVASFSSTGLDTPMVVTDSAMSHRNKIINGNFDFWQRGISQTSSTYASDDRWYNGNSGSTKTHSLQSFTLGQTDVPGEPTYYSRTVVTSVAGVNNFVNKRQSIESVRTLAGKTVTVSFYAKADASKNMSVEFEQYFGSGGSPSAAVNITPQKIALTTSWQRFELAFSIPSISGKTLGTDGKDNLALFFWFDAGSTYNSRTDTLGQQSGTFDIAQVQVEEGSVATPFEKRPIQVELDLCRRYYVSLSANTACPSFTDSGSFIIAYSTPMRSSSPTVTHLLSDATFSSSGSPPAGSWGLQSPGVVARSKSSGTFTWSIQASDKCLTGFWYGAIISGTAVWMQTDLTFAVDAEL
jgi:hypothetical protein